jgi:hypothetical protein
LNQAQIDAMIPSKRNEMFIGIPNPGRLCITTMVSGAYQWYIPLFAYRMRKAYPEYDFRVMIRGDIDPAITADIDCVRAYYADTPLDGYRTAALRFLIGESVLAEYDYVLFTDIDMMFMRETPNIVDQHMLDLRRSGLECYSNYVSSHIDDGRPRLPGVHFITKDWWDRTRPVREKYLETISSPETSVPWYYDEVMLADIVKQSGLPIQDKNLNLWAHHGVHLGDYRRAIEERRQHQRVDAFQQSCIIDMLKDTEFMDIVVRCSGHYPIIGSIFDMLKGFMR